MNDGVLMHGLVLRGDVLPGTSWCIRDKAAWWAPGERGTRARAARIDLLVGHWTGGEAGTATPDDDGPRVVAGMKARARPDGQPMSVAIHFVIGGAASRDEPAYAPVWQCADPGITACSHVGDAHLNGRSVGVEVVNAGLPGPGNLRLRKQVRVPLLGRMQDVLAFSAPQLRSWVRLAEALAAAEGFAGVHIPRRVVPFGAARRLTPSESRSVQGAIEHIHAPRSKKVDAGGLLLGALVEARWAQVLP